jgi:hypothetical protein
MNQPITGISTSSRLPSQFSGRCSRPFRNAPIRTGSALARGRDPGRRQADDDRDPDPEPNTSPACAHYRASYDFARRHEHADAKRSPLPFPTTTEVKRFDLVPAEP